MSMKDYEHCDVENNQEKEQIQYKEYRIRVRNTFIDRYCQEGNRGRRLNPTMFCLVLYEERTAILMTSSRIASGIVPVPHFADPLFHINLSPAGLREPRVGKQVTRYGACNWVFC